MKLLSMTDYVLKQFKDNLHTEAKTGLVRDAVLFQYCIKYANFLKTPLELGMFVPCDEDGNIIKPPSMDIASVYGNKPYQQAKERVIFEGFEVTDVDSYGCVFFRIGEYRWHKGKANLNHPLHKDREKEDLITCFDGSDLTTIEDLIKQELTLTEAKAKSLGLNINH